MKRPIPQEADGVDLRPPAAVRLLALENRACGISGLKRTAIASRGVAVA
jgi:hypothetical protein